MCHKVTAFYRCERRSARVFFRPSLPGLVDLLTSYPGRLPYQRHEYNQGIEGCRPDFMTSFGSPSTCAKLVFVREPQ